MSDVRLILTSDITLLTSADILLTYTPHHRAHLTSFAKYRRAGRCYRTILVAVLAEGHALLEGVPGTAKTLTVKTLARIMSRVFAHSIYARFNAVGHYGNEVFNMQNSQSVCAKVRFSRHSARRQINRTPPKTQAALLEAMEERQTTIDGERHELSPIFTFGTENPMNTKDLSTAEAQLDGFY